MIGRRRVKMLLKCFEQAGLARGNINASGCFRSLALMNIRVRGLDGLLQLKTIFSLEYHFFNIQLTASDSRLQSLV